MVVARVSVERRRRLCHFGRMLRLGNPVRLFAIFIGLAFSLPVRAAVVTNLLNPPLVLNPFRDDEYTLDLDMDQNGVVDFRLYSSGGGGGGGVTMYLNWPARLVTKTNGVSGSPNIDYQGVAGLPFGTVLGSALPTNLGNRTWWTGFTNKYDLTQQYGNHESGVLLAPVGLGDVGAKEGVIGVEFLIGGQVHYGYIHFDFRVARGYGGYGGYIYGWAYESTPNLPITAERLRSGPPALDFKINFFELWPGGGGAASIGWNAIVGETNRVQVSEDLVTWNDVSTNLVVTQDFMSYVAPPSLSAVRFFRIVRGNFAVTEP